jgi:hypothetical protein
MLEEDGQIMKIPLFAVLLLLATCAKKPPASSPPPAPEIAPSKARPIEAGDIILKHPEVLSDGTVVCHHPIEMLDAKKRRELNTVYLCR